MIYPATNFEIQRAATLLRNGQLIAFPTETVYGLGADAKNVQALQQIFAVKGRPSNHPLIVHLADFSQLNVWVSTISIDAKRLAAAFWPGPLTLILPRAESVSDLVTGGQNSIGVRIPSHPVAQALLRSFNDGIAAPSANRFGHVSPTQAQHVQAELGESIPMILDAGACKVGIESTIIDLTSAQPRILRPGFITAAQIEQVLQKPILIGQGDRTVRVSGHLESHYAPQSPLKIVANDEFVKATTATVIISFDDINYNALRTIKMSRDPILYAHDLYSVLRQADALNPDQILLEQVPDSDEWLAIRDRLGKAAA